MILIHAIYPSLNYIASTRSIGYVSIFFPFAALYLYHFNNYISASASSSIYINSTIFSSLLNLSPYLFALFFFISVCFVFLSSQQGSQFTISLILSLLFLDLDFGTFALAIMASASFFMLQFPVFNYGQHIFTHLMNRFHESEWILRTYGYIRYSYKRLSFAQFKSFISDAILHRYVVDNFLTPYKKSNWLVSFLAYRVYLYALAFLILFPNYSSISSLVLITKVVLATCLVPAVICNFQPLRGYGPPALYLNFFYPLVFFTFSSLTLNSINNGHSEMNYLVSMFMYDSLIMLFVMLYQLLASLFVLIKSTDFTTTVDTLIYYPERSTNVAVASVFNALVNTPLPDKALFSIITPELHLQSMVEAALLLRNQTTDRGVRPSLRLGWTMIDNLLYGFYSDYDSFTIKPQITDSHIRPDIILFDETRRYSKYYSRLSVTGKLMFKAGPLSLVDTRAYYSKNINE